MISPRGKIAVLVDDGVATGLTLRVGIQELKHQKPAKIVVAVPVVARSTADVLQKEADKLIALEIPSDYGFKGAVGAYYEHFPQIEDEEVIDILKLSKIN
jgi:predicted phosphoribosyltransferase